MFFLCVGLLCLSFRPVQSAHVVGFASGNFASHHRLLWKLGKELGERGHKYTHILPNCSKEIFSNVDVQVFNTSLSAQEVQDAFLTISQVGEFETISGLFNLLRFGWAMKTTLERFCEDFLQHNTLITELKVVDLVLCDSTNKCCYILVDLLNATRVDVSPHGIGGAYSYMFSNPQAPFFLTIDSSFELTRNGKPSFLSRLRGFVLYVLYGQLFSHAHFDHLWEKYAQVNSQYVNAATARRSYSIGLIPHDFALDRPRPLRANVKMIGPIMPRPPSKLPDHLSEFMAKNDEIVLVSFGSILSNYPTGVAQVIADALSNLSVAVLWKYTGDIPSNVGNNIRIVDWIPQNDILGHLSTKVLVTHGGFNSFHESVYHGVPMVVIPIFGDQFHQANTVQRKALGVMFYRMPTKSQKLTDAIHEVLTKKKYKENVDRISVLLKDRKHTPVEEGANWIELVLRHNGAAHLTSEAFDLPEYQLNMFDVFLFLIIIAFLILFVFVGLCCRVKARSAKFSIKEKQN